MSTRDMCLNYWMVLEAAVFGMDSSVKIDAIGASEAAQQAAAIDAARQAAPDEYQAAWSGVARPWLQIAEGQKPGTIDTTALKMGATTLVEACAPYATPAPTEVATPAPTSPAPGSVSAANAARMARQYIAAAPFSPSGLVKQLEHEGFTTEEATAAVEGLTVDWNAQAVLKAQDYVEASAFSRSGLIEQLEYEGFTYEQAAAAADSVGL